MIQLFQWLRIHLVPGLLRHGVERRRGHERRQRVDRRCEPRHGESVSSRRFQQRRGIASSRR